MNEWKPIETAPKGGASVLLYNWGGRPIIGYWGDLCLAQTVNGRAVNLYGWRDDNSALLDVSHWMPLPDPPVTK